MVTVNATHEYGILSHCPWCDEQGRCDNGTRIIWTSNGPRESQCNCYCHIHRTDRGVILAESEPQRGEE